MKFTDLTERVQRPFPLQGAPQQYGYAVLVTLFATLVRYELGAHWGLIPPFTLYYVPIVLIALLAGFWPGIVVTTLSGVSAGLLFLDHSHASKAQCDLALVAFLSVGVMLSFLADLFATRLHGFEKAIEGLDEIVAVVDRRYRYVMVNQSFLRQRRLKKEEVLGRRIEDVLGREIFLTKVKERLDAALEGQAAQFEARYRYPGAGERDLLVSYLPIPGCKGINRVACVLQDITEKKRAEEQLSAREQQERLRAEDLQSILDTLPIPVLIAHDAQCSRVTTNRAGREHFNLQPGSDISLSGIRESTTPQLRFLDNGMEVAKEQLLLERAATTGLAVRNVAIKVVLPNGMVKYELGNAAPLFDGHGQVRGAVAAALDVTALVEAEASLRKSEEHFRILVEQAPQGIFIADAQGKYLDVNSAGAEMLGYTREEILKFSIGDIVAAEELAKIDPELRSALAGEAVCNEWKFRRKDGSYFPGEVYGRSLPDGRVQGILVDITERKRAEEVVRQNEERFRVSLKDSPISVFNQSLDLRYTWIYNPRLYLRQDILGRTDDEILGPEKARGLRELKQRVVDSGVGARDEVVIRHNGRGYSFDLTVDPVRDTEGNVIGITGAAVDIARLRDLADSLQDAKDKLAREKTYLEDEIQSELGFEQIIGQSSALRDVLDKARVVAPTDSSVLLLGETGTGKELVARAIHELSSRQDKSFIKLNCAVVPTGLLESELFGHEKGAFTGAVSQKVGRLELADKGTLFLDEIGEMPAELQPKLLRVLQDREFERLGGVRTIHVDVRIISATNRDLRKEASEKTFREDLFYRLNVFPIELPSLRDRRSDIPMLVQYFVHKHSARMGKTIDTIPEETMTALENWNWPGNIRELENMIERMVILSRNRVLAAPPIDLETLEEPALHNLRAMEREHIIRVLRETGGILSGSEGAASRLGVKRTTLQSMLKRFNIQAHDYRRGRSAYAGDL
jgi:formate hydrogenlyase transcriptional activator